MLTRPGSLGARTTGAPPDPVVTGPGVPGIPGPEPVPGLLPAPGAGLVGEPDPPVPEAGPGPEPVPA